MPNIKRNDRPLKLIMKGFVERWIQKCYCLYQWVKELQYKQIWDHKTTKEAQHRAKRPSVKINQERCCERVSSKVITLHNNVLNNKTLLFSHLLGLTKFPCSSSRNFKEDIFFLNWLLRKFESRMDETGDYKMVQFNQLIYLYPYPYISAQWKDFLIKNS